jgi:hypothetical protein
VHDRAVSATKDKEPAADPAISQKIASSNEQAAETGHGECRVPFSLHL